MTDDTADEEFPTTALVAAVWSFFEGRPFDDPAEFNRRVHAYHARVEDEDTWDPDEAVPLSRLRVKFFGVESPDDEEYEDFVVELESDGAHFTAGELLFKLHNAVAPRLEGVDHCYFEGLYLTDDPPVDGVPMYEMMQGS
jgi:hypothetical protein